MLHGQSKRLTHENLYLMADSQYRMLLEADTWIVSGKKPPAFTADAAARPLPPWKLPPKAGEPNTREFKGRPEYWCGKNCGWNRTHSDTGHKTKGELREQRDSVNRTNNAGTAGNNTAESNANRMALEATTATTTAENPNPAAMTSTASSNATFLQTGSRS
jgi:hypothetical protein